MSPGSPAGDQAGCGREGANSRGGDKGRAGSQPRQALWSARVSGGREGSRRQEACYLQLWTLLLTIPAGVTPLCPGRDRDRLGWAEGLEGSWGRVNTLPMAPGPQDGVGTGRDPQIWARSLAWLSHLCDSHSLSAHCSLRSVLSARDPMKTGQVCFLSSRMCKGSTVSCWTAVVRGPGWGPTAGSDT